MNDLLAQMGCESIEGVVCNGWDVILISFDGFGPFNRVWYKHEGWIVYFVCNKMKIYGYLSCILTTTWLNVTFIYLIICTLERTEENFAFTRRGSFYFFPVFPPNKTTGYELSETRRLTLIYSC